MGEPIEVRGHLCDGLREHFAAARYGCIPRFGATGTLDGCDDTNTVAIRFCPYCGVNLEAAAPPSAVERLSSEDRNPTDA